MKEPRSKIAFGIFEVGTGDSNEKRFSLQRLLFKNAHLTVFVIEVKGSGERGKEQDRDDDCDVFVEVFELLQIWNQNCPCPHHLFLLC